MQRKSQIFAICLMSIDLSRILESDLFTFICGPDEKPVVVHSHAFISVSEVLKAMVTNGMKETNDKTAKLPEVSGRIFQLFSAWCYSGTYRVVAHIKKTEEPVPVLSTLVKRRNPGREPAHLKTTTRWDTIVADVGRTQTSSKAQRSQCAPDAQKSGTVMSFLPKP